MVLTCMWTTPSGNSLFNNHPLAHSMPERASSTTSFVQRQQAQWFNVPNGKLWKFHMRLRLFQIISRSDLKVYACNATYVGGVFA